MALDFSSVFDLNRLLDGLVHKNIAEVDLLLGQIGFWAESFSFEFEWQSFLCT